MIYTVLLVDDEPYVIEDLKKIIDWHKLNYKIIGEANDVESAMVEIRKNTPNLIISDIRLIGKSGLEMMKLLKKQYMTIPVIFISAYEEFEYAREAISLGAVDYLLKPVEREKLEAALTRIKPILERNAYENENSGSKLVNQIVRNVSENIKGKHLLSDYAEKYNVSPNYLGQIFIKQKGINFSSYVSRVKIEYAKKLMKEPDKSLEDIGTEVGYSDYFYFRKVFKKVAGISPTAYRNNCKINDEK